MSAIDKSENDMQQMNEWFAEKCSVQINVDTSCPRYMTILGWDLTGTGMKATFKAGDIWTLTDPRCMQVVREKFHIDTCQYQEYLEAEPLDKWRYVCTSRVNAIQGISEVSVPEAEQACGEAIWRAA